MKVGFGHRDPLNRGRQVAVPSWTTVPPRLLLFILLCLLLQVGSASSQVIQPPGPQPTTCSGSSVTAYGSYGSALTCGSPAASGVVNAGTTGKLGVFPGNGTTIGAATNLTDSGSLLTTGEAVDINTYDIRLERPNAGGSGTSANKLAKLSGASALILATTDTTGAIGVVSAGAGNTGTAQISIAGTVTLAMDGSTTAGDYVQISSTVAGDGTDVGATCPTNSNQIIGKVLATGSGAANRPVALGTFGCGGGGVGTASNGQLLYNNIGQIAGYAIGSEFTTAGSTLDIATGGVSSSMLAAGVAVANLGFTPPPNTRNVATTAPLSGGGNLSADRTLSLTGPSNLTTFTAGSIPMGAGTSAFTASEIADVGSAGVTIGSPTGGAQGAGTINAQNLLVNGVAVGTGSGNVSTSAGTTNAIPQWTNATTLSSGLPVGTTGTSTILETDGSGNEKAPVSTTTGAFSGQITSTLATGTAPLVVASTTNVANLNASSLNGATFAAPGAIGGTTRGSGLFTTLGANSTLTTNITGSTQCVQANSSGVLSGAGGGCAVPAGSAGNVQYNNGGVFGALTNTQLTANILPFSSSLSGATPASGGGISNFLRADGAWTVPPLGPAPGSSGNVLYNNAGAVGALSNTALTADINAFSSSLSGAVPASGGGTLNFLRADATFANPTAAINAFTTSTSGAAPASGGGTANFLRADGTWNVPPGVAVGASGAVQSSNGAGAFAALTNTQLTADINTFTSGLKGAVPASGGGTTNFMRADGTWAVPAGTAGGSSGQVQVNSSGVLAGLPLGTTGINTVLETDASGNAKAPVNTTTGTFSGALSVGGAITASGLASGSVVSWVGLDSGNHMVLGTPGGGSGTVNSCSTADALGYFASTGTAVSCLAGVGTSGQVLTSNGAGVAPSFQNATGANGISNQTAGKIPVASSATTADGNANAPLAYGTTGNSTIVQTDSGGHIASTIIPNTTVIGGTYDKPAITVDAAGRLTAASTTTTTLSPGLTSNSSVYNTGTQTLAGNATLSTQFILRQISSAGTTTIASTDGAYCSEPTVFGVTFQLPAPGAIGTSSFATCFDQTHTYTVSTPSGVIYGCGVYGSSMTGIAFDAQFITDGTNWKCAGGPSDLIGVYYPSGANIAITNLPSGGGYFLDCQSVVVSSSGATLSLYVGEGNTSTPTWMTGANYYHAEWVVYTNAGTATDGATTGISLLGDKAHVGTTPISIRVWIGDLGSSAIPKIATVDWAGIDTDYPLWGSHTGHAYWSADTNPIVGFELNVSTGNISGGACYLHKVNT